jgi:hypothetical protein
MFIFFANFWAMLSMLASHWKGMKMQICLRAGFFLRFKIHLEMGLKILYTRNLYYFFDYSSKFFEMTLGCITNNLPHRKANQKADPLRKSRLGTIDPYRALRRVVTTRDMVSGF